MITAEEMGLYIAKRRKEKGLTQKDLAEKLFVTDKAVSRWERGKGYPDIVVIKPLAEALDVPVINSHEDPAAAQFSAQIHPQSGNKTLVIIPFDFIMPFLRLKVFQRDAGQVVLLRHIASLLPTVI